MNALPDDLPNFPDPPMPSDAEWQRVRAAVRQQVLPRRGRFRQALVVGAAIAASVLVGVICWPAKVEQQAAQARVQTPPIDWLAEFDVLPIATSTHYMVSALNGPNDDTLLTVDHPLKARMSLAAVTETTLMNQTNDDTNRVFLDTTEVK